VLSTTTVAPLEWAIFRDGLDIDQPHVRIGRRFEIDDTSLCRDHRGQVGRIGHVDMGDGDAEPGEPVAHEGEGAAIQRLVDDDLVARGQQRPQGSGDRAHAGSQRQPGLGAFQHRNALFQQVKRRVRNARIDVSRPLACKHLAAGFGAVEGKGRGQVQRWRQRALMIHGIVAVVDGAGGEVLAAGFHDGSFPVTQQDCPISKGI
jgi:hypothetical protein